MWEVTNETLFWGPAQHRNSVFFGKRDFVEWSFKTAAKYFPSNKLVINEAAPNVIDCYGITGEYFALLKVRFRSTMELDNFLTEIQVFGETKTNIVLSTYKED